MAKPDLKKMWYPGSAAWISAMPWGELLETIDYTIELLRKGQGRKESYRMQLDLLIAEYTARRTADLLKPSANSGEA